VKGERQNGRKDVLAHICWFCSKSSQSEKGKRHFCTFWHNRPKGGEERIKREILDLAGAQTPEKYGQLENE